MIARHTLGKGFHGLLSYLLREGREGEALLLGGNMSGRNARELTREFGVFRRLNPKVSRPVFHASLRLPTDESLTDGQWQAAAAEYLTRMGYTDTAYVVVRHPENHVHIAASRVRFDGSTVHTWKDRWRALAAMRAVEQRFDLPHHSRPTAQSRGRRVQLAHAEERLRARRVPLPKGILAERLDQAVAHSDGSRESFDRALRSLGIEARWHSVASGRVTGATFRLRDYQGPLQATMKGSAIGPAFAWPQLALRLAGREREHLAALGKAPGAELQPLRSGTTDASRQSLLQTCTNRGQERLPLPVRRRETLADHRLTLAQAVEPMSTRLVADARIALARQERWNGHLGADALLRRAAQQLGREHPEVGVSILVAALAAACPGARTAFPGGVSALAAHLEAARSARAQEETSVPGEDYDYATR